MEVLMEDSETSVLSLQEYPPSKKNGTSHGGLVDFGSELTKNPPPCFSWTTVQGVVCGD